MEYGGNDDDDTYHTGREKCFLKSRYLRKTNRLVAAQSAIGGIGFLVCSLAVFHIYARGRDRRALSARLVLAVLLSNIVYAITDIIPSNYSQLSGAECGDNLIGPRDTDVVAGCLPTAIMFFGVYCTTMYELMMVLVSTRALRSLKTTIPQKLEWIMHILCISVGIGAFIWYYTVCREVDLAIAKLFAENDYNSANFDTATRAKHFELDTEFSGLSGKLWGWALLIVGMATLCWIYQRLLYHELLMQWRHATAQHDAFAETDAAAIIGLDPTVSSKRKLLQLRKLAYDEVAKPLEPYILVILTFVIPQIIILTSWCKSQNETVYYAGQTTDPDAAMPCLTVTELVLAFRAPCLGVVYFLDRNARSQTFHFRDLCLRGWRRFIDTVMCRNIKGRVRFDEYELNKQEHTIERGGETPKMTLQADHDIKRMGSMASERLLELDEEVFDNVVPGSYDDDRRPTRSEIPYQRMD